MNKSGLKSVFEKEKFYPNNNKVLNDNAQDDSIARY